MWQHFSQFEKEYFAKLQRKPFYFASADHTVSNKESHAVEWNVWTEEEILWSIVRDTKKETAILDWKQQRDAAVCQDLRAGMRERRFRKPNIHCHPSWSEKTLQNLKNITYIFTQIFNGNLATVVVKGRLTLDIKGWLLHLKQYVEASNAGRSGIIILLPLRHWKNGFTITCVHLNQV